MQCHVEGRGTSCKTLQGCGRRGSRFLVSFRGVVRLVRTPACHAGGRGFESRRSRQLWNLIEPMNCGSGMSCWRRLRDWQEAGIWQLIHFVLLDWLARYGQIDWSRAVVDGSSVRAVFGGPRRDRVPPTEPSWAASAI